MNIEACREWGVTIKSDTGATLESKRRFWTYDEAREWARASSHYHSMVMHREGTGGVGEIVIYGYERVGDGDPVTLERGAS